MNTAQLITTTAPGSRLETVADLRHQNRCFRHTAGVSQNNRGQGFRPGFQDSANGSVYLSRFSNGQEAPFHLLDGLPEELIARRDDGGGVVALKRSVVAGFVRDGLFYTREEAAAASSIASIGRG